MARIAPRRHLAGLNAVFYALAYSGFLVPAVLAVLSGLVSYSVLFVALGLSRWRCLVVVFRTTRDARRP